MHYPIVIIADKARGGATIVAPDLPGLVTEGDSMEEALQNLQEAVELYLEDADHAPAPSSLDAIMNHEDVTMHGGVVAFADLDLSFLDRRPQKITVSLPTGLLKHVDAAARKKGMTRSGFLAWSADLAMRQRRLY